MTSRVVGEYAGLFALLLFVLAATLKACKLRLPADEVWLESLGPEADPASRAEVELPVGVTDRRGQFVCGLEAGDFRVFENGRVQSINSFKRENLPVTVGLVLDTSDSMRTKHAEVFAALFSFLESINPRDEFLIVNFSDRNSLRSPSNMEFTDSLERLEQLIRCHPLEGETALRDAVLLAMERVKSGSRERKTLVIITDGNDNASRVGCDEVLKAAGKSSIPIHSLEIVDDAAQGGDSSEFLAQLAEITGGTAHIAQYTDEISERGRQIARELHEQYTLVYRSTNPGSHGNFRTIRVVAETSVQSKLFVRTRIGYTV